MTISETPPATRVPHLSVQERAALGKAARAEVPRSAHGRFEPSANRPDPVELLEAQARRTEGLVATLGFPVARA